MGSASASPAGRLLLYTQVGVEQGVFLHTGAGFWVKSSWVTSFGHFRYLWQNWEGGRVSSLVSSLDRKTLISGMRSGEEDSGFREKTKEMVNYLRDTKGTHDGWASEF